MGSGRARALGVEHPPRAPSQLGRVGDLARSLGEVSTFVALGSRRAGIGRALTAATLRAARERGFRKVWAPIRADNPAAVAFYRSQGFRVIGTARAHALVRGAYLDEVLAERLLP